jgi:O-antigen ligase
MKIQLYIFILLLTLFTFNLNGVVFLVYRITALFSIPALLLALFAISLNIKTPKNLEYVYWVLKPWLYFFMIYIVLGIVSLFFTGIFRDSNLDTLRSLITTIVVIFSLTILIFNLSKQYGFLYLVYLFTLFLTIATLFILVIDYFSLRIFVEEKYGSRNPGLFVNPNDGGLVGVITYVFLLYSLKTVKRIFYRVCIITVCVLVVYATFLTFSKAALIGILVVSLLYIITHIKKSFFKLIFATVFVLFFFNSQWDTIKQGLDKNQLRRVLDFENILTGEIDNETTTGRSEINENAWYLISEKPFAGYGLGNFQNISRLKGASHNTYFQIWGEAGIITLIIFVFILLKITRKGFDSIYGLNDKFLIFSFILIISLFSLASNNILDNRVVNIFLAITAVIIHTKSFDENSLRHR